jgi:8-oxo-dGTP pyrophosphatase MutT (NUDIX family)
MEIKDKELHRVAVTTIVYNSEGKYLITQRSPAKKAFPGKWVVPGGGLTVDDYMHDAPSTSAGHWHFPVEKALRRELREEVNIEIDNPQFLLDISFIRGDGIPVLILSYYARYKSGDVKIDEDTVDFAWVTLEEAKKYDLIESIWEQIEMVDKKLKKID